MVKRNKPLFEFITPIRRTAVFTTRNGFVVYDGVGKPHDFNTVQDAFAKFESLVAEIILELKQ